MVVLNPDRPAHGLSRSSASTRLSPVRVRCPCRPLGFVTLGVAGHLAVGPQDVGRTVSVDVSDWIRTNGLTVLLMRNANPAVHQQQYSRCGVRGCLWSQRLLQAQWILAQISCLAGHDSLSARTKVLCVSPPCFEGAQGSQVLSEPSLDPCLADRVAGGVSSVPLQWVRQGSEVLQVLPAG